MKRYKLFKGQCGGTSSKQLPFDMVYIEVNNPTTLRPLCDQLIEIGIPNDIIEIFAPLTADVLNFGTLISRKLDSNIIAPAKISRFRIKYDISTYHFSPFEMIEYFNAYHIIRRARKFRKKLILYLKSDAQLLPHFTDNFLSLFNKIRDENVLILGVKHNDDKFYPANENDKFLIVIQIYTKISNEPINEYLLIFFYSIKSSRFYDIFSSKCFSRPKHQ